jgi:uncharacterized damage-inducible protein DinB
MTNIRELLVSPFAYMPPARVLDGLTAEASARRANGLPHSAVEILAHMLFWQSWFLDRCRGFAVPMPTTAAIGWPAAGAGEWDGLRDEFLRGIEAAAAIAADADSRTRAVEPALEFPPLSHYTVGDAVTHVAVHNAHHLGQIVTMRQLIGAWPPPQGSWTW